MSPNLLIEQKATELGFHLSGISGALSRREIEFHEWWVNQGFGAEMNFLKLQKKRRRSLEEILPGAKSVVVCAMRFPGTWEKPKYDPLKPHGKIARYALHEDYHNRLLPKLEELAKFVDITCGVSGSLAYVDTGAISERSLAVHAGLGWIGKNSMLINPDEGSWFWLGEVITRAELTHSQPMADHCGKCRRCLDACPTGAILEEIRSVDSKKCLSYWNIEHRGAIPEKLHAPMGDWLLGCDICQEVCPWNEHSLRKSRQTEGPPPLEYISVEEILSLTEEEFRHRFKSRAVSRAKFAGLKRNAAIVKNNFIDLRANNKEELASFERDEKAD